MKNYVVESYENYREENRLTTNNGRRIEFLTTIRVLDELLIVGETVGNPLVKGAKVTGEVIKNGKQSKVVVYKYVQKNNYHKKQGHRQPYTKVEIKSIKA